LIYNSLLDAFVQCGDAQAAHEHFQRMSELTFVDVVRYNIMLKSYLRGEMVDEADEASQLLQEVTDGGLSANKITHNELLNAKVQSKDCRCTRWLMERMQAARMNLNEVTCFILLNP
jgi:pentatricopeptide repeat protein